MAIGDAYSTAATYRGVIGKTDTADDAAILVDLKAVSRYLEGKLGRWFTKDASDIARVYVVPYTGERLVVDDLSAAPTSVIIDLNGDGSWSDAALAATDYQAQPLNALLQPEAWPYTSLVMTPWGKYGKWSKDDRVQVTAKFGWPAVPDAVARATIHLTAILRLETPRATRRIEELGQAIEASADAQRIIHGLIAQYRRGDSFLL